jgi:hypothetical protein
MRISAQPWAASGLDELRYSERSHGCRRDAVTVHLESVVVGYLDIFLEYSIYLTNRSICLEYSDIYLEYVNPFPIPGINLEYA